jgi:hypothetical protein
VSLRHPSLRQSTYAKRLIILGFVVTLGFSAIFGTILWDMGRRDRDKALDAADRPPRSGPFGMLV